MRVKRSRTLPAGRDAVWRVVADPAHLPRWWPHVERVEDLRAEAWTAVLLSPKGKQLRADYTLTSIDPEHSIGWRHELEESAFERLLSEDLTEIVLEPQDGDRTTQVAIQAVRSPRGLSRLGGFLLRRATGRQLDEALDGLARIVPEAAA